MSIICAVIILLQKLLLKLPIHGVQKFRYFQLQFILLHPLRRHGSEVKLLSNATYGVPVLKLWDHGSFLPRFRIRKIIRIQLNAFGREKWVHLSCARMLPPVFCRPGV